MLMRFDDLVEYILKEAGDNFPPLKRAREPFPYRMPDGKIGQTNNLSDTKTGFVHPSRGGMFKLNDIVIARGLDHRVNDIARKNESVPGMVTGYKRIGFPSFDGKGHYQAYYRAYRVEFRNGDVAVYPVHYLYGPFLSYAKAKKYINKSRPINDMDLVKPLDKRRLRKDAAFTQMHGNLTPVEQPQQNTDLYHNQQSNEEIEQRRRQQEQEDMFERLYGHL